MLNIVLPYIVFLLLGSILEFFGMPMSAAYMVKTVVALLIITYFYKSYKLKFKWTSYGIFAGVAIFFLWVGLEGFYPLMGADSAFDSRETLMLLFRTLGAILVAPLVEELFTRGLLIRYLIDKDWEKVKHGSFTWVSFIFTVAFFGFSHSRWLPGILTGIILNLVWYKEKAIEPCIIAHAIANVLLAIYVLSTGNFAFW